MIGVDWIRPGAFSDQEIQRITAWYSKYHGAGDMDCARFVTFWLENDHQTFKNWRRLADSTMQGGFEAASVPALVYLYSYTVLGWERGALYEIVAGLRAGVTKRQIVEIMALAFIQAGPRGISEVGRSCSDLLREWDAKPDEGALAWPRDWYADRNAFASGIDFSRKGMDSSEVERLGAWYLAHQGEIPGYVSFLAKWSPETLKSMRQRYEGAIDTLPKQMVPLMMFHLAAMQGNEEAMRRGAFQARKYGIRRNEIISTMNLAGLYVSDFGMSAIARFMDPTLSAWPDK